MSIWMIYKLFKNSAILSVQMIAGGAGLQQMLKVYSQCGIYKDKI